MARSWRTRDPWVALLRRPRNYTFSFEHQGESAVESLAMLQRVVDTTTDLLGNTTDAQLSNPTLCTEWTVKDLVNHMVTGATMFAISAEQGSIPDDQLGTLMGGDNVGSNPQVAWDTAAQRALKAFEAPGVMEKIVKLPFGEMP